MSGDQYPILAVSENEEDLLFATDCQDQARIGYLRGDFGRGTEFWTT